MRHRIGGVIAASMLLASCSTYGDIRAKQPAQVQVVQGRDASKLADCVIDKLQIKFGTGGFGGSVAWHKSQDRATAHVSETDEAGFHWDLALTPTSNGMRAELRSLTTIWGTLQAPPEIWQMTRSCGATV